MYLSGKPIPFETSPVQPQRAGLRIAPAPGEPTGLFEVIEMAVLVIVTALAMVSIIVASSEDESRQRPQSSNAGVQQRPVVREPVRHGDVAATYASARANGAAVDVATR